MRRVFHNQNGSSYAIIKGGIIGRASLLMKLNPDGDGYDFIVCYQEVNSWGNGEYFKTIEEALEAYEKRR